MTEQQGSAGLRTLSTGVVIGAVEVIVAASLAALVFSGLLKRYVSDGIGLYVAAAAITLALLAWRGGARGVVGSLQATTPAVLAVLATPVALSAFGSGARDFVTVVLATMVVTVVAGITCVVLGIRRRGDLVRFVPYPVVGGFLAGVGWLLVGGGVGVAMNESPFLLPIAELFSREALVRWVPAVLLGALLLIAPRVVRRPFTVPLILAIGFVAFAIGLVVTGSSIDEVRSDGWLLLGTFDDAPRWQPWSTNAIVDADPIALLEQAPGIAAAILITVLALAYNVNATEVVLDRDLDTNRELRDAGVLNVVSGALGGIPGYHALSLTALAARMNVSARTAGLVAAAVPLAAVLFGASVIELIPRLLVGGVLVFLGLAFIVEWVWDKRKVLPRVEYVIVLLILGGIIAKGFLPGVVLGLVLAVVLFAVSYGRIELVREVAFGDTYRSNVDRSLAEREALRQMSVRVAVFRLNGFVFFGSANALIERIRTRVQASPLRFLVMDLRRVSGVDSSAVASFVKIAHLAEANGFELVFTGASGSVREQLARGGVVAADGVVAFVPDLDRGLQRCEDVLLAETQLPAPTSDGASAAEMPAGLRPYLERAEVPEGTVLIRRDDEPKDVFVLASGKLRVQTETEAGTPMRLRTIRPGVVVGEVAMYTGAPRTADVVAETPVVVLRLTTTAIDRIEAEDPELATAVHRWLARTLAERLAESQRAVEALVD
jgi:sulfate permease, SulP family